MSDLFDGSDPIVNRAIAIMGGPDAFRNALDADNAAMKSQWNQDITSIGRILRAHLFVEHYLTEHLQVVNPRLGDLDEARLAFAQKVHLLEGDAPPAISYLVPGIKRLNAVRNRLAHNLAATVTDEDAAVFLSCLSRFRFISVENLNGKNLSEDPLDVLDRFAEFAASSLHNSSSAFGRAYLQAIEEGYPHVLHHGPPKPQRPAT
ncbi:hypothetical protein BZM27_12735 [Paraburkholderia steynii]|uniref:Uncharacterized protein n=1 Tax=Paraburkholderia steynii TaxID=1245441 RepID=A0A4R0XGQ3_9BURK|nr:hypothetical protein BZM27_12735 [Paraburkholderia steynii]